MTFASRVRGSAIHTETNVGTAQTPVIARIGTPSLAEEGWDEIGLTDNHGTPSRLAMQTESPKLMGRG